MPALSGSADDDVEIEHNSHGDGDRCARIRALATEVLGDEARAHEWLSSPKKQFDGKTPLQMLGSCNGAKNVECLLRQAHFGNVG